MSQWKGNEDEGRPNRVCAGRDNDDVQVKKKEKKKIKSSSWGWKEKRITQRVPFLSAFASSFLSLPLASTGSSAAGRKRMDQIPRD